VRNVAAKVLLAGVSLLLLASMGGGFLLLPALVPLHLWAARDSGTVGRVLWCLLPVATAAMVAWALTYVAVGEARPAIWLAPILSAAAAAAVAARLTRARVEEPLARSVRSA
jgi:hypothetical protein